MFVVSTDSLKRVSLSETRVFQALQALASIGSFTCNGPRQVVPLVASAASFSGGFLFACCQEGKAARPHMSKLYSPGWLEQASS